MKSERQEERPVSVTERSNPAGDIRSRWSWVEPAVWTERMLMALENGVKGEVWFSLIDKVWDLRNLRAAFARVKANGGAAGVDHQTTEMFEKDLEANLQRLGESLRMGTYRPQAIRRVYIPKPGGKELRPLGIPTIRDRTAQAALRHVLEPIFEREFAEHSYGFRPNRGCKDALRRVDELLRQGFQYVVDVDLRNYFDSIPHDRLEERLHERVADRRVLGLITSFLTQGVLEGMQTWTPTTGCPQGAVISPLLSNVYLNPLDHLMASAGEEMVRYADDLVILCRTRESAELALKRMETWAAEAGLTLHPTKTRIVDFDERGGFDFLGYHFERNRHQTDRTWRWPRDKSIRKLKDSLRDQTPRCNGRSLPVIIRGLNRTLCGWFEYFKHTNVRTVFPKLDEWLRHRLRRILLKREKRHRHNGLGRANQRWPIRFFREYRLFSLAMAHAAIHQSAPR